MAFVPLVSVDEIWVRCLTSDEPIVLWMKYGHVTIGGPLFLCMKYGPVT